MKNKKVLLFSLAALFGGSTLMAQTGQWKLAGNNLNGTEKLGSLNNQDVRFISNNVINGFLSKNGRWGFGTGTSLPAARLHINSASGEDALRVQVSNSTKLLVSNTGGVTIGSLSNGPINGLFVSGNTGIGTSTPSSKLHVQLGNSGITPFFQSVITAENSNNAYMNILAPSANETGVLFGTTGNSVDGGIIYNSVFQGSAPHALQFRTNGNFPRMVLTAEGNVGIGTTNPTAKLEIADPGEKAAIFFAKSGQGTAVTFNKLNTTSTTPTLRVGNSGAADGIETSSSKGNGIFAQTSDNTSHDAGFFNGDVATTGTFRNASDEKLKQNIREFSSAVSIINELHPKLYQYKKDANFALMQLPQGDHYGFIAQEVEKVLPMLVKNEKFNTRRTRTDAEMEKSSSSDVIEFKAMNYIELIPITVKAMQELSKQNEDLQKQVDELKAIVLKGNESNVVAESKITTSLTSAALEQNIPNPFAGFTSINYNLPQKFSKAQIVIADKAGKIIKQINLTTAGKGKVNVEASSLLPGSYNYSLIVDGKLIDSKQMIIAK